ncbi:hypothetical protein BASA81_011259 [Batrachochytrium salamandrivorans]|nr:hypothetical protein BASA81_011259 [Batrachochytrium salamandrivorans]
MQRATRLRTLSTGKARPEHRAAEVLVNKLPQYDPKHEQMLRSKASPESMISIESLEYEFKAEVAGALGRMDRRLKHKLELLEVENLALVNELQLPQRNVPRLKQLVERFNLAQKEATEARMDLICQRQSAGFEIDNTLIILRRYPIPAQRRVKE